MNGLGGVPPPGFGVVPTWLDGSRPDFVNNDPDDDKPDVVTGYTMLFLYFLFNQASLQHSSNHQSRHGYIRQEFSRILGAPDDRFHSIDSETPTIRGVFFTTQSRDNVFPYQLSLSSLRRSGTAAGVWGNQTLNTY